MRKLYRWLLPRWYSSNRNDNGVILPHIQKTDRVENLDWIIFRNCSDVMFPVMMCKTVLVRLLSSEILKVRSFVNSAGSCEGSSWTSCKNWCRLHEDRCWTRIRVWNKRNRLKDYDFQDDFVRTFFYWWESYPILLKDITLRNKFLYYLCLEYKNRVFWKISKVQTWSNGIYKFFFYLHH